MAKGRKTGGRTKGTPNHVTSAARQAFLATFGKLEGDLETWIRETAKDDPGKASDLVIRMAEYHFPKLGRAEVVGPDGGPVEIVIRDLSKERG
jgi:hypothetical protein